MAQAIQSHEKTHLHFRVIIVRWLCKLCTRNKKGRSYTPLFILDDVEMPSNDLGSIKSEDIESVTVLKEKKATEPYGEKGKNGVVIITTKKYKEKKSKGDK
jgi:TonB-dependent SusC/RagA subfamily outer membrane receptor